MSDVKSDIESLITSFYEQYVPEMERYKYLELVTNDPCTKEEFYSKMIKSHIEIRKDTAKKARYFILKKTQKLNTECKNKLPEIDNIENLSTETRSNYWETVHQIYMLLESEQHDKDEAVINTIGIGLERLTIEKQENLVLIEKNLEKERIKNNKKIQKINKKIDEISIPNSSELIEKATSAIDTISNPEVADLVKTFLNTGAEHTKDFNINGMMKKALNENSQYNSIIIALLDGYNSTNGDFSMENMTSIINNINQTVDVSKPEISILTEKLFQDFVYIYEKKAGKPKKIIVRFDEIVSKYTKLVKGNIVQITELLTCVWKIANDEEKRTFIESMNNDDINSVVIKKLIKKYIPEEMLNKLPVDPDAIIDMFFTGDMVNLSSMLDSAKNWVSTINQETPEPQLTDEQMAELEEYYDKVMAEPVPVKSKKSVKKIK